MGLVGSALGLAPASAMPALPSLPVTELTLDNGLRLLVVPRPESRTVAAGWVARVGSIDERPGATGLTHFLEHMLFKGSETIASGELGRLYAEAGGRGINALTLQDMTLFFVTLPAEKLELWFWLEADRLRAPVFREIETEKKVVAEERRLRTESTPTGLLDEELRRRFWGEHPYAWPTLGVPADVAAFDAPAVRGHFEAFYRPDNVTAVLVGPLDPAAVRTLAERYFGRVRRPSAPKPVRAALSSAAPVAAPAPLAGRCECRPQVEALYRTVPYGHADTAPLEVLVGLLNGRSGRLYRNLVAGSERFFAASALQTPLGSAGTFAFTAEGQGTARPEELLAGWDAELARLREEPPSAAELERVQNQIVADGFRRLRDPAALMMQVLMAEGFGAGWREVEAAPRRALAVTAADVQRVAERYLRPEARTVGLYTRRTEGGVQP